MRPSGFAVGDSFEKRIPHGLLRKPYSYESRAKIRPAAFSKGGGRGAGRTAARTEGGARFPRMNAGGALRRGSPALQRPPYLGLRFFRRPEGFFKGCGPIRRLGRIDCKRTECAFAPRDKADAVLRSASLVKEVLRVRGSGRRRFETAFSAGCVDICRNSLSTEVRFAL